MSRTKKLYERLDNLESEFKQKLVGELRRFAEGRQSHDELLGSYLLRRPFPMSANQRATPLSESMLKMEREILSLRKKLGDDVPGEIIGMVDRFEALLKGDLDEKEHEHGNSWAFAARTMLAEG